ncbi:MAG: AAA family ATPase [Anaerotruncus rubiinfantis]|jgi:predicted ATPase|uniref:AAA family ATPase n=1 Tax=Anaerotruncus rubiinfantis TaxID=1720200 RepID=UPI00189C48E1|nr:AAA family ATPase [Anaerotruncus rubiinfantis]
MNDLYIRRIFLDGPLSESGYLEKLPLVKNLLRQGGIDFTQRVTFFVGENGTGKSTLLEALAVVWGFNPEGGSRNFAFSTADSHSALCKNLRIWRGPVRPRDGFFLRAESFYNVASYIDELDRAPGLSPKLIDSYGGRSLHGQSHGESFLSLVMNRFGGNGLYILDEPEAALSPSRQMALFARIVSLAEDGSQLLIATHSPILLACPKAQILELSAEGITTMPYEQTEHYQLTKAFLNNPERMLRYLLEDDPAKQ